MENNFASTDSDVVLLHGLARSFREMSKLAQHLKKTGYRVHNLDYRSTRDSIESLSEQIAARIADFRKDSTQPLHFVGHSMGSIITHWYIQNYRPENLGRVVALGPPFRGSEIIDHLGKHQWYRWIHGPAALELATGKNGICHRLQPADYQLGIIAGDRYHFRDWFFAKYWLPKPNDGKVTIASTHLPGCRDHIILPVNHIQFPEYPIVIEQTAHFLSFGAFQRV